jgi:RNA polymerase sigma-70 factor, ECF subfamily
MEPSVRPYNSNRSGQPRRRATKGNNRPEAAPVRVPARKSQAGTATRKAIVETRTDTPAEALPELAEPIAAPAATTAGKAVKGGKGGKSDKGGTGNGHTRKAPVVEDRRVEEVEESATAPAGVAEAGPVVTIADFEDIFSRFQTPLINFVFRLVGNREQACDLTQDVFVKAYRALSSGTTIQAAALSSWLYRIASNTATDALRRRRLISWLPLSLFNEDRGVGAGMPGMEASTNAQQGPSEDALASAANAFTSGYDGGRFEQRVADREIVESVLKRLPPKYAACLLLYEHEGFSCAEIADVLNVSPSAVKMRLMRARERFITLYRQEVSGQ